MMWRCGTFEFDTRVPVVMGILNLTPDSFSDGGSYATEDEAIAYAKQMVADGAQIIDVGGESTRPNAEAVPADVELSRVISVVTKLAADGICVSIDTRHALVAKACVDAGASIVNDVTGFTDPMMLAVAKSSDCGLVVMHCGRHFANEQMAPGTLHDMIESGPYRHDSVVMAKHFLWGQVNLMEEAGIAHERICIDPGPGFGKDIHETINIVRNLHEFRRLGYPVMAALSRKSYIGYAYHIADPKERDGVSATEALMACELGATVLRVHNVPATMAALKDLRPYCVLSLGCNVPLVASEGEEREGKIAQLNFAIGELCQLPDTQVIDIASFYESEPAYYLDQDRFVNTAVVLRTGIPPKELLDYLHVIENNLGRVREIPNGPRTCDIDIVDYQMYVCQSDVLTLPHPRAVERDFVVSPIEEILPGHILADGTPIGCVPRPERIGQAELIDRSEPSK